MSKEWDKDDEAVDLPDAVHIKFSDANKTLCGAPELSQRGHVTGLPVPG